MKVARLYAADDIRIEDEPVPEVGPGDYVQCRDWRDSCIVDAKRDKPEILE